MSDPAAPRRAELILEALGPASDVRDAVIGDLAEEFALRVRWDGPAAARRWYYRESMRVAPFLLGDWWRGLRQTGIGDLATAIVLASASMMALEWVLQLGVRGLEHALGAPDRVPVFMNSGSAGVAALMLVWTLVDGALAGYVAARIGRRAPLPSALALGVMWTGLMILAQGGAVPPWFRAANVVTLMAAMVAGAAFRACRVSARTATTSVE